jgi:hypothetical protein
MSPPKENEVRKTLNGRRTFVVLGDAGDGSSDQDMYRYVKPHTLVLELSTGTRFAVPTDDVARWPVVTP